MSPYKRFKSGLYEYLLGGSEDLRNLAREIDPFNVPLNVFKHLDIDQIDALYQLLHEKYGDWIRERLKESNA